MKYLAVIGKASAKSWNAFFPDFPLAFTTASTREAIVRKLPEFLSLCLEEYTAPAKPIESQHAIDPDDIEGFLQLEFLFFEPILLSPISLEVARVIDQSKLSHAEIAKRMKTTPSVISRMRDPNYRGHSVKALTRLADAVGAKLTVRLET